MKRLSMILAMFLAVIMFSSNTVYAAEATQKLTADQNVFFARYMFSADVNGDEYAAQNAVKWYNKNNPYSQSDIIAVVNYMINVHAKNYPAQADRAQALQDAFIAAGISLDTSSSATTNTSSIEALKTYSGNTSEFNAYNYYTRYADLQTAIGADGDALLAHYNNYGKAEGRNAK